MKNYTLLFSLLISLNTIAQNNIQPNSSSSYNYLNEISSPNSNVMISEYVRTLSTDTLFVVLELSSIEENSEILFSVGSEIIYRIKNKLITNKFINQLSRDNISNEYLGVLFMILNKTFRSFQNEDLILIFNTSSFYVTNDFYSNPNKLSLDIRLIILKTNNLILTHLNESNQVSINKVNKYCRILQLIMVNNRENPEIRAAAIKGIQYLNYKEATNSLIVLMSDYSNINNEVLMQPLCIILSQFNEPRSFQLIESILKNTTNEYVFASAAISLGDLGGLQSLKALIENENKFEGKYTGVAIRRLNDDIFTILKNRNSSYIDYAIKATKYLYKEDETIQYKKLLKSILFTTQNINHIKLILDRLYQVINKEEASEIISKLTYNNLYLLEWNKINNLQKTETTPIKNSNILVPEKPIIINNNRNDQGNMTQQEYGDAAYQDNTFDFWIVNYEWCGHAGLYAGINSNHEQRQIAVTKVGTTAPRDRPWTNMTSDPDNPYWGAYTLDPNSESLSFTDRKDIISTAIELIAYAPSYPAFNLWPDALNYFVYPGIYVYPYDIEKLRCDGLVEYCYEWNYHEVWGYNSANYDISITSNVDSHNYCFHANYQNPCETLAPIVQCGGHGNSNANGGCSNLDNDATIDYPTYNANYSLSGNSVNVSIQANDKSGIHYIKYKVGSDGSVIASPTQPQHPTSSSYTYSFTVAMSESDYIYFYAKDNGGNYPQYYSYIYITLPPDPPSSLNATAISSSQINLSWTNVPDEDGYKLYRSLSASGTYSQIETLGANVTTYSNTDLNPNTQYCYKVEAYNGAGNSGYSSYDCATTFFGDYLIVTSPNGGEEWEIGSIHNITWDDNIDENVRIELLKNDDFVEDIIESTYSDGIYSWTIPSNLEPDIDYTICIVCVDDDQLYDLSDDYFEIWLETSFITVTSPNGGEDWEIGSTHNITWDDNIDENVRIELLKNDDFVEDIIESTYSDGIYSWTIPTNLEPDNDYSIGIVSIDDDELYDISDGHFEIWADPQDYITVTSPNGGEDWEVGTSHTISWDYKITGNVKIELYVGSSYNSTIISSTSCDGSYTWNIPANQPSGTNYKVKITSLSNTSIYDFSDGYFEILPADYITVTSPNGGEDWEAGTSHTLTWDYNITGNVKIELYVGSSYNSTIISSTSCDVSYTWSIPANQPSGTNYKVKITSLSNISIYDFSDDYFEILPSNPNDYVTVYSPNSGESWQAPSQHIIEWGDDIYENVKIELYKNGFIYFLITNSYPSDGSYPWTVPSNIETSNYYKIKIVSVDNPDIFDFSDEYFTIINSDGINDLFISNNLKVYPNPTNNSLIIETTSIVLSLEKVIITDMIGKEIYKNGSGEIGSRLEINVSMFNAGVYFTTLYTNKGAITKKIIIQH